MVLVYIHIYVSFISGHFVLVVLFVAVIKDISALLWSDIPIFHRTI